MATVIDALIVTLGLDASGMKGGQKDASKALKDTEDQAARTAKELEARGKQAAQFFGQIRNQVVGLFAAFTAGAGLKAFVADLTNSDAAIGRLAKNINMTSSELTAWQGVAERSGGSASGIANSLSGLSQQFQQIALTGKSAIIPYFRAVGVQIADASGKMRPMGDILLDLADKFRGMDPARAQALGRGMGLDEGTVNVLMQGRAAVQGLLAEQEKLGHANEADTASAQARQAAFRAIGQASEDLGRKLLTAATPAILAITDALTRFAEWAAQHRPMVEAIFVGLTAAVVTFTAVLAAPLAGLAALSTAIAAAVAAIALLYDDWKTWVDGGQAEFGGFWQFFADKWAAVSGIVQPVFEGLKTLFADLVQTYKDYLKLLYTLFTGSSDDIKDAWDKLFSDLTGKLSEDFSAWIDLIKNLAPLVMDAFKTAFSGAITWVEQRVNAVWGAITGKKVFANAPEAASVIGGASGSGQSAIGSILGKAKSLISGGTGSPGKAYAGADQDVAKFMAMGWSREQAAGIVANIARESSGNETTVGDNGKAYGLGQWHPDRQANFTKWAGHDIRQSTRDEQLAFINHELREGTERAAGKALADAKNAAEAGAVMSKRYERPADVDGEAAKRAQIASLLAGGPKPDPALMTGAGAAIAANTATTATTNTSHSETNIGTINVQTAATDAKGIASGIGPAIKNQTIAMQANYGLS